MTAAARSTSPNPRRRRPRTYTRHKVEHAKGVQTCSHCHEVKPLDAFSLDRRNGRPRSWCKPCQAAATREWKQRDRACYLEGKRRDRRTAKARGSAWAQ